MFAHWKQYLADLWAVTKSVYWPFVSRRECRRQVESMREFGQACVRSTIQGYRNREAELERKLLAALVESERIQAVAKGRIADARRRFPDLEKRLAKWHIAKYGCRPVSISKTMIKLGEEFGELSRALLNGDKENAREEAADCAIVLVHLVRGLDGSLADEMERKAAVIEKRLQEAR